MENLTAASFDFDNIVSEVGKDPFAASSDKYAEDNRFYKLGKDKEGNGGAIIRFMPDKNRNMIQQVYKVNTTIEKNDKKRFVNELSPNTIGMPCPFQEKWQELWNAGDKEESKKFGRSVRFYTNIKVIKDPANPANEGKIFLLDMSGTLKDKIQKLVNPSQADKDLGAIPRQLFNPIKGNSFRLVARKGTNGITNYDSSDAITEENGIYENMEAAFADIRDNTFDLNDFKKPETFLPYDKLQEKLRWVTFADAVNTTVVAQVAQVASVAVAAVQTEQTELNANVQTTTVQPVTEAPAAKEQSLDDMLAGLI